jgi:hypothetical protein
LSRGSSMVIYPLFSRPWFLVLTERGDEAQIGMPLLLDVCESAKADFVCVARHLGGRAVVRAHATVPDPEVSRT